MSESAAIATACIVSALAFVVGALWCLADHLLTSAVIYTALAILLMGGAAKIALDSL
jgi:hypothetical protein